jgi:hypothetical protein
MEERGILIASEELYRIADNMAFLYRLLHEKAPLCLEELAAADIKAKRLREDLFR